MACLILTGNLFAEWTDKRQCFFLANNLCAADQSGCRVSRALYTTRVNRLVSQSRLPHCGTPLRGHMINLGCCLGLTGKYAKCISVEHNWFCF